MMTSRLDRLVRTIAAPPSLNHLWERARKTRIFARSTRHASSHIQSGRHGRSSPFRSSSSTSSRGYVRDAAAGPTISEQRLVDYFRLLARVQKSQERSLLASIGTLSDQADRLDGIPLDALLEYEADPAGSRRVLRTDDDRGLESLGRDDGEVPTASPSISSTDTDSQEGQQELEGRRLIGTGILSLSYIIAPIDRAVSETHRSVDRDTPSQEHEQQHVVTCTGFLVQSQASNERILVTCAHTLWQSRALLQQSHHKQSQLEEDSRDRNTACNICSGCVARDQLGNVFLVKHVLGALASADLLFFKLLLLPSPSSASSLSLQQEDLVEQNEVSLIDSFRHFFSLIDHHDSNNLKEFRTLPVSPYPLPLKSPISVPQLSPSSSSSHHIDRVCFQWEVGRVVEYKDTMGIKATPGTYDPLNTIIFDVVPRNGSSGAPIVDHQNGTVVGMVRGFQSAYDLNRPLGFGTVSERFWELFLLPGFHSPPSSTP
ncbi:hypothetical protein PGT21_014629 [Puccinia graminis f. sp. tritici]|uniref:Serine protease n=1 Tax=Puccinia graminis f. sp. tritici TaxID=56615 RepID=A0A5B0QT18_PUCGR|nr:hypothetical protein PGT21_014629 [Puccinia graminis f. sp. tritici]